MSALTDAIALADKIIGIHKSLGHDRTPAETHQAVIDVLKTVDPKMAVADVLEILQALQPLVERSTGMK